MDTGMGFALSHMAKCGWKEGQGLGKEETGMKEAIKVKLKFDSTGFGHDRAEEFKFQWWDHVFNKAAENISVSKNEKGCVELQRKEELVVSKSRPSVSAALMKEKLYGSFVKGATLHGSEEVSTLASSDDESDEDDGKRDMSMKLSDDQLFKLCGGKTAHKGARHGLNMNAKLERIRQQEEELMQKWKDAADQGSPQLKSTCSNQSQDSAEGNPKPKKIKKHKRKDAAVEAVIDSGYVDGNRYEENNNDKEIAHEKKSIKNKKLDKYEMNDSELGQDLTLIKKKKKKKHKRTLDDSSCIDKEYVEVNEKGKHSVDENKSEKKRIIDLIDQDKMTYSGIKSIEHEIRDNGEHLRKKKKRKNKEGKEENQEYEIQLDMEETECNFEGIQHNEKKKKKKSKKHDNDEASSELCSDMADAAVEKKNKKKKKNKEMVSDVEKIFTGNGLEIDKIDKVKKKKRKLENEQLICSSVGVEVEIQKKKKSKKSKSKDLEQ